MKYVIGISTMGSSAACLLEDNNIIFAIEEERLSRIKNDSSFPFLSIQACLDYKNITINDIHTISVYWNKYDFITRLYKTFFILLSNIFTDSIRKSFFNSISNKFFGNNSELSGSWLDLFKIRYIVSQKFNGFTGNIDYHNHHLCHAVSAYVVSDKSDSTCLIIDGGGESTSTEQYIIRSGNIIKQFSIKWPNSLGHYYSFFTGFLGFKMLEGEYKMMGLSPFGSPTFAPVIEENILKISKKYYKFKFKLASYHSALNGYYSNSIIKLIGLPRHSSDVFDKRHMDIAASVQYVYEKILLHILNANHNSDKVLLMAGGCALNVSANGKIIRNRIYDKIFVPPCPHDAGAAIGAAILSSSSILNYRLELFSFNNPYLGPIYSEEHIECAIIQSGLKFIKFQDTQNFLDIVASKISTGSIVAWFQGRSEFGPRALGNRSLLADPRFIVVRDLINEKVKQRELFRPFAPSCKIEVVNQFFDIDQDSPYMNIAAEVLADARSIIPAVTHIDGTARVHTVKKELNEKYWGLLNSFEKITGVGVLLNTSFNIQEPIVETPEDALACFISSGIDYLAIDNFLVVRDE
ncbi:carbamoyltransferase C-terminal domain-containing protein [Polynucleobacter sp. JS-JIR-5-A7]|uniref:carbamoyltransferase family protein n=1 Tax=Polynucleobacter sp. JS-JIR-5-A7 TaxID=1758395 RepID=UPI001BFE7EDD|nr:carbamoyltransferase C-terminal domain-containing protein [Polynucleobacter sp. JS-JIR-5-A7]QWE06950.1 hypothetical protein AOC29_01730 [Polynucleobacter sp. JS-JIR-5-A7]